MPGSLTAYWAVGLAALVGGCGGAPPPVPPTVVNVTVSASSDVNGGPGGAGAPVAIRIYQLVSPGAFQASTFFPLFEKDAAALKDDLVKREDILLGPGQSKALTLMPEDRVHSIGVFAAYRDYEHVGWHTSVDVPLHQTSKLTVTAGRAGTEAAIALEKPPAK